MSLHDMVKFIDRYPLTKDRLRTINAVLKDLDDSYFMTIEVPYSIANKYKGDLSGLLNYYGVPIILHPYTMSINNASCSDEYTTDIEWLKLIKEEKIKMVLDYVQD